MTLAYRLPDPYQPEWTYTGELLSSLSLSAPAAGAWPTANLAMYVPVIFPADCTLYAISFRAINGTGNYDLGFYNSAFKRLSSSGSTAMTAAGTKTLTLPEYRIRAGSIYYAALALSSTGQLLRYNPAVVAQVMVNCGQQATALPLPDPMVPAVVANAFVPMFVFGVR